MLSGYISVTDEIKVQIKRLFYETAKNLRICENSENKVYNVSKSSKDEIYNVEEGIGNCVQHSNFVMA